MANAYEEAVRKKHHFAGPEKRGVGRKAGSAVEKERRKIERDECTMLKKRAYECGRMEGENERPGDGERV